MMLKAAPPRMVEKTGKRGADDRLEASLRTLLGNGDVRSDAAEIEYLAHDIAGRGPSAPAFVVTPRTIAHARDVVRMAVEAGRAIVPRGGGMSYTGGYQPCEDGAVVLDMQSLNRVVEINEADGFVIVEAGCTWATLYNALAEKGLRTLFFGPLSGIVATVGGALSQNAAFFGSAQHGVSSESVLGLEIILANGTLLRTGTWAAEGRTPFQRAYGPDLTGLFLGDCGALGVKCRVALKIQPMPHSDFASFALPDSGSLVDAQASLAGLSGLAECFGFDPVANDNLVRSGFSFREKAEALGDVAKATGGVRGLLAAVGVGARRMAFLDKVEFSLHIVADGADARATSITLEKARDLVTSCGGIEIPNSIPLATRARPFRTIKALLGPEGEVWLPVHGLVPMSKARAAMDCIGDILSEAKPEIERHAIRVSMLTALVNRAFLIEPQFFWRDALGPFQQRNVTASQQSAYGAAAANLPARELVHALRARMATALDHLGGAHFQIGRYYGYRGELSPAADDALLGIKAVFDPTFCMNPGALGLARRTDYSDPQRRP